MFKRLIQFSFCLFFLLQESQELNSPKGATVIDKQPYLGLKRWQWWLLVALNIAFLLVGQTVSTLLGRFYYDQGGNSKWMATLVQTVAFPILYIPLLLTPSSPGSSAPTITKPSIRVLSLIYIFLGLLLAANNMMYSVGLLYLPVSTYSLLCATQLAFNAVFSFLINRQKFTALILNSVVILTLSASLLAVGSESSEPTGVSKGKYILGFISTLCASAVYSLLLSLMQFSFEKVIKKQTFSVVLDMQIYTSIVATCACIVGLFASGEWSGLTEEMVGFKKGKVSYVMTLVWTAIAWQICSVGVVGLIFVVSSLFSNVISTLALPLIPIVAVITFHDKMDGVKVIAMLMAIWGFSTHIYQNYLDDSKLKATTTDAVEVRDPLTS
ncbi:Triose-phosphate transporter domain [Macleaya cordata]|uniref:Probable purine permease n=1 Tax=Macleaya cordata TaxID=56857 RepID=A0A200PW79_MACCD|nr:Triose-phosphate transporter domain [Macleaya cordata]